MTSEKDVAEIKESLATITRLLAAQIGVDLKVAERAPLLDRLGVDRHTIAAVCGTNPEVVSVRLAEARRGRRTTRRNPLSARAHAETAV